MFNFIKEKRKKYIEHKNTECNLILQNINQAMFDYKKMFEDKNEFIDSRVLQKWKEKYSNIILSPREMKRFKKATHYKELKKYFEQFILVKCNIEKAFLAHNDAVANKKVNEVRAVLGNVEGRALDFQQMLCIAKDNWNHLVIAGAGTGKTTTIVGKIKYLLKTNKACQNEILVLSFTNASATEMKSRIEKETGASVDAMTFHKLGLNIISKVDGIVPKITKLNLRNFIENEIKIQMESPKYAEKMLKYIYFNRNINKTAFDFKNAEEYNEYLKNNPPTTLKGEVVKSYGEMDIANFLFKSGIKYIYEYPYCVDTRTSEHAQYYPDFYLPDYDIYIEYFGINKAGKVPEYYTPRSGKTPSEEYIDSIRWKRNIHEENHTKMIECYSYEYSDGALLDLLEDRLNYFGIPTEFNSVSIEDISIDEKNILDGIVELFMTAISLMKSNQYTIKDLFYLNETNFKSKKVKNLIELLSPIYDAYVSYLVQNEEIDFNDMINKAASYVSCGKFTSPYKYVIVDEYQDMAKARYNLLQALRKSNDYKLFCVGDDWQSIYRFAGSDIGLTFDFEKYWGPTERSKIETTYRFNDSLIQISGDFIMQNPQQIKKRIKGKTGDNRFALAEINGYTEKKAIEFMLTHLDDLPLNSSVYFIGRYAFDIDLLNECEALETKYDKVSGNIDVFYKKRKDLKMQFLTAHKSKGLQADYVFIINNKDGKMGFPSKVQDSPLIKLLLDNSDYYDFAEERRLFYVALTRARIKTYIITVKNQESLFAQEMKNKYSKELKKEFFTCPICGGSLVRRTGPYGDFWGCSNYKATNCRYTRKYR